MPAACGCLVCKTGSAMVLLHKTGSAVVLLHKTGSAMVLLHFLTHTIDGALWPF